MRCLLVGAGAVGQVYARHLQLGGAEVAFLVRPKYAAEARAGFDMYPLDRKDARREPVRLEGFSALTAADEVARARWDAVLLCVASTALREGTWLADLARAAGDATIVMLQPGIEDRDCVLECVPAERLLSGMIGMVSYHAPLPGESVPRPGIAYWLPPLAETPLSGPRERAEPVVEALVRGGIRSRLHPNVPAALAFGGAVLDMHIAALECTGWSFRELRRDPTALALASRAAREAIAIASRRLGVRAPLAPRLVRPCLMRIATRLAPRLAPLDLETYFRVHFTKVGAQRRLGLRTHVELAERFGLECGAIRGLAARLGGAGASPPV